MSALILATALQFVITIDENKMLGLPLCEGGSGTWIDVFTGTPIDELEEIQEQPLFMCVKSKQEQEA